MKIKSNASSDEISSPFYEVNKMFCSEFESYIALKNGKVKGEYNAWSYLIFGKITAPSNWTLMYKKSTLSSGNLFFSSEYQNLLVLAQWKTLIKDTNNSEFIIRKKARGDFLKKIVDKSLTEFELTDKYILEVKGEKPKLITHLTDVLENLFLSGEIYRIEYRNDELKIEMRTKKHHFDIFDKLTAEI